MAKRETKQTYQDTRTQASQAAGQYQTAQNEAAARAAQQSSNVDAQRAALTGGYGNLQAHTIGTPGTINTSELSDTLGGYKGFRDTGGLSNENINRMRGLGGYDEFAQTGGYSPAAIANIKAQALSPIGSYATGTRDELERRRALQGGYAPGFDSANRQLQRDTARNIADTSLAANVGIQDRINQGRMWGIGGLTDAEGRLAGMQTGNRLSALGGEAGVGSALSGFRGQDIDNAMRAEMFNANMMANTDLARLGGLGGIYNTDVGQYQNELARQAALINSRNQTNLGYLGNQSQLAMQPGIGGNLMNLAGTGLGIASQFFMPGMGGAGILPSSRAVPNTFSLYGGPR